MINYENDYINLVVLGSFNPGILTHGFLTQDCRFNLATKPEVKRAQPPVVASLEYGNISFFADLGRLEIKEKNCDNPQKSEIPSYLAKYLDVLQYTPLTKCGANFSCKLSVQKQRLGNITDWLKNDRSKFRDILKLGTLKLEVGFNTDGNKESIENWTLRTSCKNPDAATMLKVLTTEPDNLKIDFNYEVGNLDKDRSLLKSITDNYSNVVDMFNRQIESIFIG